MILDELSATFKDFDKNRTLVSKLWPIHQGQCLIVVYALDFKQLACDIWWDEITFMS
jgi:hypothetical protein